MKRDVNNNNFNSSFLSCEKDIETILRKLFVESSYKEILKRLLVINTKDCLEVNTESALAALSKASLSNLIKEGYIRLEPKLKFGEHEEVKAYIIMSIDNYAPNTTNPQFRDCTVNFDIICHTDYWNLGDYRLRPLKIAGYIDGILNECKLSGIGTFNFLACNELILNEDLSGYTLTYRAVHGSDDIIPSEEE
ncbi:MAG: hypothetical protein Q4E51_09960 [Lachnospiraceae bacterium]|nr:hypothetical protein [Lachnospiraceae bacterium]